MSQVAYGKRDLNLINKRERIHFLYRVVRKIQRVLVGYNKKQIKKVATYPAISNESNLVELANKIAWAFPSKTDLSVYIVVSDKLLQYDLSKVKNIPNQRNYLQTDLSHIHLVATLRQDADTIFYLQVKEILKSNFFKLYKTEILDKNYFSITEGALLQSSYFKTFSEIEKDTIGRLSVENLRQMQRSNKNKHQAYCFVTGPSFDRYKEFKYSQDSLKVICNSTVKNDAFMAYIGGPDIVVFADPVFHFSPCEYSAVFRDEVVKAYKKYQPFIIVPFNTVSLLLAHYPMLKNRIIGMKSRGDRRSNYNFPAPDNFWVKSSSNILTLYMLPVASSIAQEIFIIGADGRNSDEKYFWQHSRSAQFTNLMSTVFETHPSFFRDRDYEDYYEEYCNYLEDLISYGESIGKKYISLTKSYIPALKKRMDR